MRKVKLKLEEWETSSVGPCVRTEKSKVEAKGWSNTPTVLV